MSSLHVCFAPVNGYDIPGLEAWLEQMAARGLRFAFTWGALTWFERAEPAQLRIHLEPVRQPTNEEDQDLSALYAAQGWDYAGLFRGTFYLYSTADLEAQAHTDPEIQSYSIARLTRRIRFQLWGLTALLFFLGWLIQDRFSSVWSWDLRYFPLHTLTTYYRPLWLLPLFPALVLLMLSKFLSLGPLYRIGHALARGEPMARPKKLRGGRWLKAAVLTLLLVPVFWLFQVHYSDTVPLDELAATKGYVRLKDLESRPGFSLGDSISQKYAYLSWSPLVPGQYSSRQFGGYNIQSNTTVLENGGTMTTYSSMDYYLETEFLRCLTPAIADAVFQEQSRWSTFQEEDELSFPGFDRLILHRETVHTNSALFDDVEVRVNETSLGSAVESEPAGLTRWNLYAQKDERILLVEYHGQADLTDFLPRFAQMLGSL